MTRDEILGEEYSPKGLVRAFDNGFATDYIAQWYYQMTRYELKEVLLSVLYTIYDSIGCNNDDEYDAFQKLVVEELADREFGSDD